MVTPLAPEGARPARQDRVKVREEGIKTLSAGSGRVSHGVMTFENVVSLVIVSGLLAYLVTALILPDKF